MKIIGFAILGALVGAVLYYIANRQITQSVQAATTSLGTGTLSPAATGIPLY